MGLQDIKFHTCPEDEDNATLLVDVETETVPVLDADGNLLYYCAEGQHVFSVNADGTLTDDDE